MICLAMLSPFGNGNALRNASPLNLRFDRYFLASNYLPLKVLSEAFYTLSSLYMMYLALGSLTVSSDVFLCHFDFV
jgi:hypothetical protein